MSTRTRPCVRGKTSFRTVLVIASVFSLSFQSTIAEASTQALASAAGESVQNKMSSAKIDSDLTTLETKLFSHSFADETQDERLDRVERLVYGAKKSGSPAERMTKLLMDLPNISTEAASGSSMPKSQATSAASSSAASSSPVPSSAASTSPASDLSRPGQFQPEDANKTLQPSRSFQGNSSPGQSIADNYPTVTALEEKILGTSYPSLQVGDRLSQLEEKAFGSESRSRDLSARVDALKSYLAHIGDKGARNDDYLAKNSPILAPGFSIEKQVSIMEKNVFGKTYRRDMLVSRLKRLENSVFPGRPVQTFTPITTRLANLEKALGPKILFPPVESKMVRRSKNQQKSHFHPFSNGTMTKVLVAGGVLALVGGLVAASVLSRGGGYYRHGNYYGHRYGSSYRW